MTRQYSASSEVTVPPHIARRFAETNATDGTLGGTMDTELTKGVVRQVVDDWNRGDLDALDEHLDPEYVQATRITRT